MAKLLTKAEVDALARRVGKHRVDENLILRVRPGKDGTRAQWVLVYMLNRCAATMSLGAYGAVTLAEARDLTRDCQRLLARGIDPKRHQEEAADRAAMLSHTFKQAAETYIDARAGTAMGVRKRTAAPTTIYSWRNMLGKHVYPKIGGVAIDTIATAHVTGVLEPISCRIPVACEEIRRLSEEIINYAVAKGWRMEGKPNPFRWKEHLEYNPAITNLARDHNPRHRTSMPYQQMHELVRILQHRGDNPTETKANPDLRHVAARILEFLIYTHVRPSNARVARWADIDMENRIWTIGARDVSQDDLRGTRMKARREHRVPLSTAAMLVLRKQMGQHPVFVFPGMPSKGLPLNACTPGRYLASLGFKDDSGELIEPHGFRSSCRKWADAMGCPRAVAELMIAHDEHSKTERAYIEDQHFEERRKWTEMWSEFCNTSPEEPNVVPIRRARGE